MGFSLEDKVVGKYIDEDGKEHRIIISGGEVAACHLEQASRRFHGVPEDATDKTSGRKRRGGASPDPARYLPETF
jgi:hypothetical protein